jgi:SAM-dependent methyltransferase
MPDWVTFWDSPNWIYVNERHRQVHYRRVADDVTRYVAGPNAVVLDYGCGEALHADRVADAARRLILCDAAPGVRAALARRYANAADITVHSPDEVAALGSGSIDLIVMHSVVQYLTPDEFRRLLTLFRRLLKPEGLLLLGDVIPPAVSPLADAGALLAFGAANGFFFAAVAGLARTALSDYRRLRNALGIRRYAESEILAVMATAGFSARRAPVNLGHNPARVTFLARPA